MSDAPPFPSVAGATHRFVTIQADGGPLSLHVAEAGRGEPLLLLHGWPESWYCWRGIVPELARHRRLIMPDLRGFGWSDTPGLGYDGETFAADAVALLDALGIERLDVAGHDWGGYAAFFMGLAHPERVSRMVVFNAPHPWAKLSASVVASLWRTWYVMLMASPLAPRVLSGDRFIPWFLGLGGKRGVFDATVAQVYAEHLHEPARAAATGALYRSYLRSARDIFLGRRYHDRSLTVPTRLVFGDDDFFVPGAYLDGFEANAPSMTIERVPGCGHFLPEERPDVALAHLREFLQIPG